MKKMTNRCFLRCPVWEQSTHHFPNHKKNHERFKAWVEAIDRKLETDEDYEYFRTKRLCHIHFIPMYCYNDRRLSPLAIPTLYLTKESRAEYWAKDLELRKSMMQSKSAQDEMPITKTDSPKDVTDSSKDEAATNNEEPVMVVPVENLPLNDAQSSLRSDVQESPVNLLIADILEGENESYTQDVQEQSMLSVPSPVESNVLNPVADIIIEYVSNETSGQKLSMRQIPRDITTFEVVKNLPREPVFSHDIPIGSTLLETYAEEIKINLDSVQNCIKQPRRKYKKKHNGLSWELPSRIPMEHNYSKASKVAATSHLSSNGLHPKKTIRTLKSQNKALRQKLKFYKQKYTDLLRMHQETAPNQIKSKKITKSPHKGPSIRKKAYKNGITYVRLKNVGSGASVPQLSYHFLDSIP